jgi:hypothetical protein
MFGRRITREIARMLKSRHLAIFVVVVGTGVTNFYFVNRSREPIKRADPPQESMELTDSVCEPIVFAEPPADAREAERSRRAVRPAGDPERKDRMTYDLGVTTGYNCRRVAVAARWETCYEISLPASRSKIPLKTRDIAWNGGMFSKQLPRWSGKSPAMFGEIPVIPQPDRQPEITDGRHD